MTEAADNSRIEGSLKEELNYSAPTLEQNGEKKQQEKVKVSKLYLLSGFVSFCASNFVVLFGILA